MARKLKTFVTSVGFFDLAVAAVSMKAALDAWGFRHNAFQQGFAGQTSDARIIKAAMAQPGIVLRRPVGTDQPFREDAELPAGFTLPGTGAAPKPSPKKTVKPINIKRARPSEKKAAKASIISFDAEKKKRDRKRAREEAAAARASEKRSLAVSKARGILEKARRQHESSLESLERDRGKLDDRIRQENERWQRLRGKLEADVDRERNR